MSEKSLRGTWVARDILLICTVLTWVRYLWVATQGVFVSRNSKLFAGDSHAFCVNSMSEWGFTKTVLHSSAPTHLSSVTIQTTIWDSCSHSPPPLTNKEIKRIPERSSRKSGTWVSEASLGGHHAYGSYGKGKAAAVWRPAPF